MTFPFISTIVLAILTAGAGIQASEPSDTRTPVLVELFTSEGCSSCPPADAYLQELDRQPIAGKKFIVLSEHVDYWNHLGWKDPYSARSYSNRQQVYATRFGLRSVYTPQMVVDGSSEFIGSDSLLAGKAFAKASARSKIAVRLSSVSAGPANLVRAHVETGALRASFGMPEADVFVAVALDRAESRVSKGENSGRLLTHTAVVRSIVNVGTFTQGSSFFRDVELKLEPGQDTHNLRLVAFVQEPRQGRIVGAAMELVSNALFKKN